MEVGKEKGKKELNEQYGILERFLMEGLVHSHRLEIPAFLKFAFAFTRI